MKVMAFVKATAETEAGLPPVEEFSTMMEEMGKFNAEMIQAGILLDADGLKPSSAGARVIFSGDKRSVVDGPFAETKELVAGYWILQVRSLEEAVEWMKRCPNPTGADSVIELRPHYEAEDFGELAPAVQKQEAELNALAEKNKQQ
ncbi:MAG: YciI family protein [Acidobacteria bacterium]|nr:YciI family protein [Acidobacteriota bacterium]